MTELGQRQCKPVFFLTLALATGACSPLAWAQVENSLALKASLDSADAAGPHAGATAAADQTAAPLTPPALALKFTLNADGSPSLDDSANAASPAGAPAAWNAVVLQLQRLGIALKVAKEGVLDADTALSQVAIGTSLRYLNAGPAVGGVLESVAARRRSGNDFHLSATQLFFGQGLLVNATLRASKTPQNDLLGLRNGTDSLYSLSQQASVALMMRPNLVLGAEYRARPSPWNVTGEAQGEDKCKDLFLTWAPSHRLSMTAAWVDFGRLATQKRQTGTFLSAQLAY